MTSEFAAARPDVVRAINQRWLLKFWLRQLGTHRIPQWQAVEAENLSRVSTNLSFLDVSGSDGNARFQIRFHGAAVAHAYGSPDCRGRYLDEIMPPLARAPGLAPYHHAVESGQPVYTIHDVTDSNGRLIHFERLLLPFASDGKNVDRILAAFEFICEDGAFDGHALMHSQTVPPALRLAATIETHAMS
jgi:hypothetical protein